MSLIRTLDDVAPARGGMLSIGNFDGVHLGHQAMLGRLVHEAHDRNVPSVVLTFNPHPIFLLAPEKAPPSLSTLERKSELLHRVGVDHVVAVPTTRELLSLSAEAFFQQVVQERLEAVGMLEGPNFQFGKDRGGDVALLGQLCRDNGMTCEVFEPVTEESGSMISSSLVRAAVADGRLAEAVSWLGHPYQLRGSVVRGDARGRQLGFPTANLSNVATLLPADGVYAASCNVDDTEYAAAVNIGGNPTFGVDARKVEVHLLEFDGDLYDRSLHVDILDRVRGVISFENVESLQRQLETDLVAIREIVKPR